MKLIVNPHKIEIAKDLVNEKEINITKCYFEFAEEITDDYVKEAYFTFNGVSYMQLIVNDECSIPQEVLENKGQIEIGVVAKLLDNGEYVKRYNPSPAYFNTIDGSLKAQYENSEEVTPTDKEQMEQALQDGLNSIDDKLEIVDDKINEIDTAITETNNLDLDVNKQDNKTTITVTKKNGSTKSVDVLDGIDGEDGTSLQFMWQGTSLGIKTTDMQDYVFVDLQGIQGQTGPQGEPFTIKKTYSSVAEMNADFDNMELGDYVMIASSVELEDNAKLFTKGESAWIFITDFSGATGIRGETGLTPNIQIGTVTSGTTPSVTRTGTNENPILNFVLEKGETGATGSTGATGATGNGIASVVKTSTSGLVDTYTVTYTNGNTSTFTVTNGKGISSIVKTSTSGLVDTYTITFNDNTTMTYTVTNGKDGIDGEVTQEQLDQVIKDLEYWKTTNNALPKIEGEGTDITLDNTANSPLELDLSGNTYQIQYSGKNIMPNVNITQTVANVKFTHQADGSIVVNGLANDRILYPISNTQMTQNRTLSPGDYVFSCTPSSGSGSTYWSQIYIGSSYKSDLGNGVSFNISEDTTYVSYIAIENGANVVDKVFYPMLRLATTTSDYEPYTNGASPNPDYPQDIHVVKGDNEVIIENKNLFDYNTFKGNLTEETKNGVVCLKLAGETRIYNFSGKENTRYAFQFKYIDKSTSDIGTFKFMYSDNTTSEIKYTGQMTTSGAIYSGISNSNKTVVGIKWEAWSSGNYLYIDKNSMQLEKGITVTSYVTYKKQTYPLTLDNLEMCNINNYADEFFKNVPECEYYDNTLEIGKWYKYGRIGKIDSYNGETITTNYMSTTGGLDIGATIYYVLSTATKELLSNTLQTQLDNISYAMAYQDQTNISQTNDDRPFVISASTIRDMSSIFDLIETE